MFTGERVIELLIVALLLWLMYMVSVTYLDSQIRKECASCDAEYSWCVDYWKSVNRCGVQK